MEARLPATKTVHQYRAYFDSSVEGFAVAVYGGFPWELFWIHYNKENGAGVHQIEGYECKPQGAPAGG